MWWSAISGSGTTTPSVTEIRFLMSRTLFVKKDAAVSLNAWYSSMDLSSRGGDEWRRLLEFEPNSTAVARSVLYPSAAILVPRLIDEFDRFPARRSVRSPVCFLFSPFSSGAR